jgi:hypothetical protein
MPKAPNLVWAPKNPHAVVGLKIRTLTNHIALKQWTYSSTLWSLMAAHLAVGRFIENVQCIKRRSSHFCITRGNIRVRIKLSDDCPFSPDIAHFHVCARRLAVFRRFHCNTGQGTRPHQLTRCLPVFTLRRRFHIFACRLAVLRRLRCNTMQGT